MRAADAHEWALVLEAEGVACRVVPSTEGFRLVVPPSAWPTADAILRDVEREHTTEAGAADVPGPRGGRGVGLVVAGILVGAYVLTGPHEPAGPWFVAGEADGARIVGAGEVWRTVTALTLHSDVSHLLGNAVAGALLAMGVARVFGSGVGLALILLAGAIGNLMNALLSGPFHTSVGASTAVLGAVGLLSGSAAVRTARDRATPRRAWLPVAAGLGLLAMLGADARTDVGAHLFGFLAGGALGTMAALVWRRPPRASVQRLLGAAAALLLAGAWAAAVRAAGG